jgi:uncharacterized protein (TIGR02147 family)
MSRAKLLSHLAQSLTSSRYLDYRAYLQALYQAAKAELGSYSYLLFADDLGFSKTNVLHLIIKGKRPLSAKAAEKIAAVLELKASDRKYFLDLVNYQNSDDSVEREQIFQEMVELKAKKLKTAETLVDQLEFFTEWYHSAIYELSFTHMFDHDPKTLAGLLQPKIRPEQARKSLELLIRMGLLKAEAGGYLKPQHSRITTGDEIASLAITRYHQKMIDLGKESLTNIPADLRDVSSISISIPEHMIPQLKQELSAFRKKILAMAAAGESPNSVYQMNIQLFPLTRKKGASS